MKPTEIPHVNQLENIHIMSLLDRLESAKKVLEQTGDLEETIEKLFRDFFQVEVKKGDILLACSDGLYDEVSDEEKKRRVRRQKSKQAATSLNWDASSFDELPYWESGWIVVQGARQHNLKSIDVIF